MGALTTQVVFVHGAGRSGLDNWQPYAAIGRRDWQYLERIDGYDDAERDAGRILNCADGVVIVVAASYGALAALRAASLAPGRIAALVLGEPACFDVARGAPAVEEHVATLAPIFARATESTYSDIAFSTDFARGMGLETGDDPSDAHIEATRRLRKTVPPWNIHLDSSVIAQVSTTVVTSGESEMYEQVAGALVMQGARHVTFAGFGHRVLDHPDAVALVKELASH